jgi:hypothetical protein
LKSLLPEVSREVESLGKRRILENKPEPSAKRSSSFDQQYGSNVEEPEGVKTLPPEIWKLIIDALDAKEDTRSICRLSQVNHSLAHLCSLSATMLKRKYVQMFSPIILPRACLGEDDEEDEDDRTHLAPLNDDYQLAYGGKLIPDGNNPSAWFRDLISIHQQLEQHHVAYRFSSAG